MRPSICITIPFYSDLSYLDDALGSLVAQTDADWTAIVVDDCSPDLGAEQQVAVLGDDRFRYVRNESNLGISANFNRCLELGREAAEIVTILHADDMLEPGFVAAIRLAHRTFPMAACVAPRATVIDSEGRPNRTLADSIKHLLWPRQLPFVLQGDRGLARLMHGQFLYSPAVSYRVDLLPTLRFDGRWRQVMDLDLFSRVLLGGGTIALVPERVYRYRRHEATATAQHSRSLVRVREETAVIHEIVSAASHRRWRRTVRAGRLRLTVRLNGSLSVLRSLARRHDWSPRKG
ncbi:MAG: glycosyltransferase [Actinomycetota bacterium]|nr:glycosyltransferase [Actinomycetota bacterium]